MPVIAALVAAAVLAAPVGSACTDVHPGDTAEPVVGVSEPLSQLTSIIVK